MPHSAPENASLERTPLATLPATPPAGVSLNSKVRVLSPMSHTRLLLLSQSLLLVACGGLCGNEVTQTVASPSSAFKAVVFSRNCGATTGINTQVSVLRENEQLSNEGANTFIANGSVHLVVRWENDATLSISGLGNVSPIKKAQQVSGVAVTYAN